MVPRPYTREHAESFVNDRSGELEAFVIVHSPSGEPVGITGIHDVRDQIASVGYWVASWGRRRGAATNALHALGSIITGKFDAHTMLALIAETNTTSRRVAERAGFALMGPDIDTCPDGSHQVIALRYEKTLNRQLG